MTLKGFLPLEKEIKCMIELYGYHIVLTTHNSRTSKRMKKYKVKKGPIRFLSLKEEIILTKIIGKIIIENSFRCSAYNICNDHVHLLLICELSELPKIVQKLKSISSKLFNRHKEVNKATTELHHNRLWSQKFFRAELDEWKPARLSTKPREVYTSSYLQNTMRYIENNRDKHGLMRSQKLIDVINEFTISLDEAFKGS